MTSDETREPSASESRAAPLARRRALDLRRALNAISDVVQNRPLPIREFDQIYMKAGDLVVYAEYLCRKLDKRRLVLVGDGDGIGLAVSYLMHEQIVDYGPQKILLLDFDERVVNSVARFAEDSGFELKFEAKLYNVADPIPDELLAQFDAFHINPPWGQYNDGRSVICFLRRGVQLLEPEGLGMVAIADDHSKAWALQVLQKTQASAIEYGMAAVEMQPNMHTYHLDDAPELASCALTLRLVQAASIPNQELSAEERKDFYGRGRDLSVRYVREVSKVGRGTADPRDYRLEHI